MKDRAFRFAPQVWLAPAGADWAGLARALEDLGYDALAMPDQMRGRGWAPMLTLAAAAAATTRLRLSTLVLNNDLRNPVLLAREVATLDVLSNGHYELGLGAGWSRRDYFAAGIPFDRGGVRVARLAEAVRLIKRLLNEESVTMDGDNYRGRRRRLWPNARPAARPGSPRGRRAADPRACRSRSRHCGDRSLGRGKGPLTVDAVSFARVRAQIAWVRASAGPRFSDVELSTFIDVVVTDDRDATILELARTSEMDPAVLRNSVFMGDRRP
ncbi:MAG: LLM class flavin-dependent oxidoreductase [Candidatus Dormibacteraeota bacterium]|nr:LLM class flavin-dependent oxidoreductase [Candidatus Dormibacteraeota bacterium]